MQASNLPSKVLLPFADSGTKNTIPVASQVGITPGAASLETGFPPLTFTPLASGGVPPAGADFNGILNLITGVQQWQSAGGIFKYDSAFSTSVGGYPKGAILESSDGSTLWLCLTDNNTTDPDSATPANWAPAAAYGIAAITGLTNANVTLTPAQYGKSIVTLAGALTGNVQIIFPATLQQWVLINNTTGNFSVTAKTASGTGIICAQGQSTSLYGDGSNIKQLFITPGQNGGRLLRVSVFAASGTWTAGTDTKSVEVEVQAGGGGGGAAPATSGSQNAVSSGGGAGGYARKFISSIASPQTVTVGAGGTSGNPGGSSSFGALVSATGGSAGIGSTGTATISVSGAQGGIGSGGDINIRGGASEAAWAIIASTLGEGSIGGDSVFCGGGQSLSNAIGGAAYANSGAGGGGVYVGASSPGYAGGAGADGIVIVKEYA